MRIEIEGNGQAQERFAALLLRRSTDRQDTSIQDQRDECLGFCRENRIRVVCEYVDDGVSGDDAQSRIGLQRLLSDVAAPSKSFDCVVAYDSSRLSRADIPEAMSLVNSLTRSGVEILFVKDPVALEDSVGQVTLALRQWQNHEFVRDASKNTLRGMVSRARQGHWCGGPPPYGYDLMYVNRQSGEPRCRIRLVRQARKGTVRHNGLSHTSLHEEYSPDGEFIRRIEGSTESYGSLKMGIEVSRLVLGDPKRLEAVRRAFQLCAHGRMGCKSIAKLLNSEAIPSPSGASAWRTGAVKSILTNPVYKGLFRWNYRTEAKYHRLTSAGAQSRPKRDKDRVICNRPEDWIEVRIPELAVVAEELWEAAQAEIARRGSRSYRPPSGSRHARYPLGGLIYCATCGKKMFGIKITKKKKTPSASGQKTYAYRKYECSTYREEGPAACGHGTVDSKAIEGFVLGRIRNEIRPLLESPELRAAIRRRLIESFGGSPAEGSSNPEELLGIQQKLNALQKLSEQERRLMGLQEQFLQLRLRKEGLEAAKNRMSTSETVDWDRATEQVIDCLGTLQGFDRISPPQRREFFGRFVQRITLDYAYRDQGNRRMAELTGGTLKLWTLPRTAVEEFSRSGHSGGGI